MVRIKCKECGGYMVKEIKVEHNRALQVFAILVLFVGLGLLIVFPIGTFIGVLFVFVSVKMGYKKRKIWLCPKCNYFFERIH